VQDVEPPVVPAVSMAAKPQATMQAGERQQRRVQGQAQPQQG
jgi:hypothetical protein